MRRRRELLLKLSVSLFMHKRESERISKPEDTWLEGLRQQLNNKCCICKNTKIIKRFYSSKQIYR